MSPLLLALAAAGAVALLVAAPVSAAPGDEPGPTAVAGGGETGTEFATLSANGRGRLSLRLLHGAVMVLEGKEGGAARLYEALARRYPDRPEAPMNLAVLKARRLGLHDVRDLVVGVIEGDRALREAWWSVGVLHARLAVVVLPDAVGGPISEAAVGETAGTEGAGADAVAMSGAGGASGATTSGADAAGAMAAGLPGAGDGAGASAADTEAAVAVVAGLLDAGDGAGASAADGQAAAAMVSAMLDSGNRSDADAAGAMVAGLPGAEDGDGGGASAVDAEAAAALAAAMLDSENGSDAGADAAGATVAGAAAAAMYGRRDGSSAAMLDSENESDAGADAAGAAVAGAAAAAMYRGGDNTSAAAPVAEASATEGPAVRADPSPWRPVLLALGFSFAVLMLLAGIGLLIRMMRSKGGRGDPLQPRLKRVAAPLAAPAASEGGAAAGDESIFRPVERRTWLSALRDRIESVYPLLEARRALPASVMAGFAGAGAGWGTLWFLRVPPDWWTMPVVGFAGAGAAWYMLRTLQARQEAEFIRQFPEIVDQIVRLSGAGVPALEALAAVANDAPKPVGPVLAQVRDGLLAGLDTGATLRQACDRIRIAEFTLFAAVIRLQRRAGGGISAAFRNLSETLRERRKTALKAKASTAQTRLTILVLAVMPAIVLFAQSFMAPESVEILFETDQGVTLLRWGVALIVTGILVVRGLAARATR